LKKILRKTKRSFLSKKPNPLEPMHTFQFGSSKEEVLQTIPERKIKKLAAGEKRLAILRIGDILHIFDAQCPHRGADLGQANINGAGEIICPLHQYRFDLKTGDVRSGYCTALPVYRNELTDTGLTIYLP
jgi:nitrite reductase/ring-hydroxylating ferredoxin subunit